MKYDLIIVAASKDHGLVEMTQRAIDSCLADGADVNVILIETATRARYRGVNQTIFWNKPFNYNACLNEGLKYRTGDVQILSNNDVIFMKGWSEIGGIMEANGILSACARSESRSHYGMPNDYKAYKGYTIGTFFCGWCIFQHKSVWDKIYPLDEAYEFWYSDNVHAEQLKRAGIEHYLICAVQVNHITSQTLNKTDRKTRLQYTRAPQKRIHKRN